MVVNVSLQEAKNRLYRRECNEIGSKLIYAEPPKVGPNTVFIKTLTDLAGVGTVLYTHIGANIEPLTAEALAALPIKVPGAATMTGTASPT